MISYVREPNGSFVAYYTERQPSWRADRRIRRGMQRYLREHGSGWSIIPIEFRPSCQVICGRTLQCDGTYRNVPQMFIEADIWELGKSLTQPILESPATRGGVFTLLDEYMAYRETVPLTSDYLQAKRLDVERLIAQQKQLLEFLSSDPDRSRIEWKLLPEPT